MAIVERSDSPGLVTMLGRQVDKWWTTYRRTWKGSAVSSFLEPWLYIAAMGVLLGGYINGGVGGASSYFEFVAPGLLAANAMMVGVQEAMWPVMGAIKWDKSYYAMLASPLRIKDIVFGHLGYVAFRLLLSAAIFTAVLSAVGIFHSVPGALAALGSAVLTGLAIVTPVYGFSCGAKSEQSFALIFRLGVMPMFLFSGAFFPISNLPPTLEWIARLTPLYHGVELCRASTLQNWSVTDLVHVAYLVALATVGVVWAVRRLTRRLVV